MSLLVKNMKKPANCEVCPYAFCHLDIRNCPIEEVPDRHGRLVDLDELSKKMYHDAFETDTPLQKWDGGCWIRYKMFEINRDAAPTVIEAEGVEE